jgi:hypothetical protein
MQSYDPSNDVAAVAEKIFCFSLPSLPHPIGEFEADSIAYPTSSLQISRQIGFNTGNSQLARLSTWV